MKVNADCCYCRDNQNQLKAKIKDEYHDNKNQLREKIKDEA